MGGTRVWACTRRLVASGCRCASRAERRIQGGYLEVGKQLRRRPPPYTRDVFISTREELLEELHAFVEALHSAEDGMQDGDGDGGGAVDEAGRDSEAGAGGGSHATAAQTLQQTKLPTEGQLRAAGRTDLISVSAT
eukprot:361095-Chlamydomonas_euryale.AAC.10